MKPLSVIVFAFILTSCVFQSDEENFVVVSEELTDQIFEVKLTPELLGDTLEMTSDTRFTFSLNVGSKELNGFTVTIDGESIPVRVSGGSYSFEISPWSNGSGIKEVKIEMSSTTGRNNLASIIGAEYLSGSFSFWLEFDGDYPHKISIDSFFIKNGTLNVSYEKYERINFKSYELVRLGSPRLAIENTDQNKTTMEMPHFVGGNAQFRMDVTSLDQSRKSEGTVFDYTDSSGYIVNLNKVSSLVGELSWKRTPFDNAFDRYVISPSWAEPIEITDIDQTSVILDLPFGENINVITSVHPNDKATWVVYGPRYYFSTGDSLDFIDKCELYNSENKVCYIRTPTENEFEFVYEVYDENENKISENSYTDLSVGNSSVYALASTTVHKVNALTLESEGFINLHSILPENITFNFAGLRFVGENGLIGVSVFLRDGVSLRTVGGYILDFESSKIVSNSTNHFRAISNSGQYFVNNDSLFEYSSQSKQFLKSFNGCDCQFFFSVQNNIENLAVAERISDNTHLTIYDLASLNAYQSLAFNSYVLRFDPYQPYFGVEFEKSNSSVLEIYQIGTSVPVDSVRKQCCGFILNNGYVFSGSTKIQIY